MGQPDGFLQTYRHYGDQGQTVLAKLTGMTPFGCAGGSPAGRSKPKPCPTCKTRHVAGYFTCRLEISQEQHQGIYT